MAIILSEHSKATPSKGIAYILNPEKRETWGCLNLDDSCGPDASALGQQMMTTQHLYGKGKTLNERKYYHYKISFHPDDRIENGGTLDAEKANEFAKAYAEKHWPGREVVWSVQADGTARHIHFIVSAVDLETGSKLNVTHSDWRNMKDSCQEMCREYGLHELDWRQAANDKRAAEIQPEMPLTETIAEKEMKARGVATWKDELRSIIDYAAATACDMDEFREILADEGVTLTRCTGQTISYKIGDHRACRGDKLGGDYTVIAIQNALQHNAAAMKQPEGRKTSLDSMIKSADARVAGGRVIDAEEREMWREFGRLGGVKRSEIDRMCDLAGTGANNRRNKKRCWDDYKKAQDLYWDAYKDEKNRINEQLSGRYEAMRKIREIEWLLDPRNYRKTFLDMIFAMIMLSVYKKDIERIETEILELKVARSILNAQCVEYRQASAEVRESLLDNDKPLEDYLDSLQKMQSIANDIYEQNWQHQLQDVRKAIEMER